MIHRRHLLAVVAGLAAASPALAAERQVFSREALDAAVKSGRPVLVEVTAPWCPTCKAQRPILSALTGQPRFAGLMVFEIDFDTQKDALRALRVQQQSTLIVFKGGAEQGRSVGDTDAGSIDALVTRAL